MLLKKDKLPLVDESSFKVVRLIFSFPNKIFHVRKLAKETGLSTTAVVRVIKELHKHGIIKIEKTELTTNIQVDLESKSYISYKIIFNLLILQRYKIINTLLENFRPEAIILFGSFAKGEDIEESDIDLLILSNRKARNLGNFLTKYEKELNRNINLHILPSLRKSSSEFKNTLANGIVLHGYIKVL